MNDHVHPVMKEALKPFMHVPKRLARDFDDLPICNRCNGSGEGYSDGSRCSACKGQGEVEGEQE